MTLKVKDLMDVARYADIELHSSFDGKLVAKSKKTLEKFGEVDVLSIWPRIDVSTDGSHAHPFLYVFGASQQILEVKKSDGDT